MSILNKILAAVAAIFAGLAAYLGIRKSQADANLARVREHIAEADAQAGRNADAAIAAAHARHREEQKEIDAKLESGKRDHMERDW